MFLFRISIMVLLARVFSLGAPSTIAAPAIGVLSSSITTVASSEGALLGMHAGGSSLATTTISSLSLACVLSACVSRRPQCCSFASQFKSVIFKIPFSCPGIKGDHDKCPCPVCPAMPAPCTLVCCAIGSPHGNVVCTQIQPLCVTTHTLALSLCRYHRRINGYCQPESDQPTSVSRLWERHSRRLVSVHTFEQKEGEWEKKTIHT